jgi:hypothetical protein
MDAVITFKISVIFYENKGRSIPEVLYLTTGDSVYKIKCKNIENNVADVSR